MGNFQFYCLNNHDNMLANAWIDLVELPRSAFQVSSTHQRHHHATVHALNSTILLLAADCNILLFNSHRQCYQAITKIPDYHYQHEEYGGPPTIRVSNISSYYNEPNTFYVLILHSNADTLSIYQLTIHLAVEHDHDMQHVHCEWLDMKSQWLARDKYIDLKHSKLLRDESNPRLVFLFYIQNWPARMLTVLDLEARTVCHQLIDDNKWFSISSLVSLHNAQFLSFNNIGPEIVEYTYCCTQCDDDEHGNAWLGELSLKQKQMEFPVHFSLYFSTANVRFSNYVIRFGSYADCSSLATISIYDWVNDKFYESQVRCDEHRMIESVAMQSNGYVHCVGRDSREKAKNVEMAFSEALLRHYKMSVELLLFNLDLLYWDTSRHSRIFYVIRHWLRVRRMVHSSVCVWTTNLSVMIMTYLCVKEEFGAFW